MSGAEPDGCSPGEKPAFDAGFLLSAGRGVASDSRGQAKMSAYTLKLLSHVGLHPMTTPAASDSGMDQLCTCFMVRSLSRKISQLYDEVLAPSGLRVTQFSLLAHVRRPTDSEALTVSALAGRMNTERTTMTRNIRALQAAGLIEICQGRDARSRSIKITPAGEAAFRAALPLWREAQARVRELCGNAQVAELEQVIRLLLPRLCEGEAA
jgi:DNA-binding MarR family transcriptional regulator